MRSVHVPPVYPSWYALVSNVKPRFALRRAMAAAGGHAGAAKTDFASRVWVTGGRGRQRLSARLDAGEGFAATVDIAMAAIAATLARRPTPGVHSPASAFGANFIASVPGITISFAD